MTQQNPVRPKSRLELYSEEVASRNASNEPESRLSKYAQEVESRNAPPAPEGGYEVPQGPMNSEEKEVWDRAVKKKARDIVSRINESTGFRNKAQKIAGLGKEFVAGAVGSVPDTAILLGNAGIGATNLTRDYMHQRRMQENPESKEQAPEPIPHIPYVSDMVSEGIDSFTDGFTKLPEDAGAYGSAVRAAGSVFGPGALVKHVPWISAQIAKYAPSLAPETVSAISQNLAKGLGFLGSTNASTMAGAATAGGLTHSLIEDGTNPALALAGGMAAGAGVGGAASWLGRGGPKGLTYKAAGLGPEKMDLPAYEAAQNLGVDIPNSVVARNAPSVRIAEQIASRFPFVGPKVRERLDRANEQFVASWDKVKQRVGPRMEEVADDLAEKYMQLERSVPEEARVSVKPFLDEINALRKKLDVDSPSGPTAAVFAKLKEMKDGILKEMPEGFEKFPESVQSKLLSELGYPVKRLINQEKETNRFLRDKNVFDRVHDKDTLMLMQGLPRKIESVLVDYGKTNKEFGSLYKSAKSDYAASARREELEHMLSHMVKDPVKDEPRYSPLARALGDEKNQKKLKRILGSDFDLVKDFQTYAKSMSKWSAANPNPSGTSSTGSVLGSAKWFIGAIGSGTWVFGFWKASLGGAGAGLVSHFLTDRKFLENAVAYAKRPTALREQSFWEAAAQASGISVSDLKAMVSASQEFEAVQKEAERENRINERKQKRSSQKGD